MATSHPGTEVNLAEAVDLSHHFESGGTRSRILTDITITVPPGQLIIMTGPSGSGKTTLLTLLGALRSAQSGDLTILGQSVVKLDEARLMELRRGIGFIFQLHNLLESGSALENVMMSARLQRGSDQSPRERAAFLLDSVGLAHRMHHKPRALSGGQRQRVAVARALVNKPRLILADEPTSALDSTSSAQIVKLLQHQVAEDRSACLMVTHDTRILDRADRIVSLVDGRIVSDVLVREQVVICEMLSKMDLFGELSAAALSQVAEKMERRTFVAGDVLVRQGEIGEEFFLIRTGEVGVHVADTEGDKLVATLEAGRYFGERALITGEVRNATVLGNSPGVVYTLTKALFQMALESAPSFQEQLRNSYFLRQ